MESETKRKFAYIIGAVAIVLLVIAVVIRTRVNKNNVPAVSGPSIEQSPQNGVSQPDQQQAVTETPADQPPKDSSDLQLKRVSLDFAARFGTYSTDAQNANLTQLLPVMGPTLRVWAQARLEKAPEQTTTFSGVTTKALSAKIISQTSSSAKVIVSTQRNYTEGSLSHIAYETATLTLVRTGTNWLVDAVTWESKK